MATSDVSQGLKRRVQPVRQQELDLRKSHRGFLFKAMVFCRYLEATPDEKRMVEETLGPFGKELLANMMREWKGLI